MTLDDYNAFCASLPATNHVVQWGGAHVWKVGEKVFAIAGWSDTAGLAVTFKVSDIAFQVLTEDGRAKQAPYLARAKWVHLEDPADWPDDELADHLKIAHGIIAAKLTKKARAELGLA